jgi:hypothetical protein
MSYNLSSRPISAATLLTAIVTALAACGTSQALTIDFEDVALPPAGYYNGSDGAGGFTSRGLFFPTVYTDWGGGYTSWENWACSATTDTATGDFSNQFSAITGHGQNNSVQYALGYPTFAAGVSELSFPQPTAIEGAYFTNTAYVYYTLLNGNRFAKKFGGESGADQDWFKLTITGTDAAGTALGPIDFYLADYRDPDNRPDDPRKDDFILDQWQWLDLSGLGGEVKWLQFALSSSDVGPFGMNTPSYFAIDNLSIIPAPEPGTYILLGLGAAMMLIWRDTFQSKMR